MLASAMNQFSSCEAGLRKLVAGIEEEQRLAGIQALRNQSRLTLLVQEADFERQVNGGEGNNFKHDDLKVIASQKWESYQVQWSSFLQKYGYSNPDPSSPIDESAKGVFMFQDIPWPLMERKGSTGIVPNSLTFFMIMQNCIGSLKWFLV